MADIYGGGGGLSSQTVDMDDVELSPLAATEEEQPPHSLVLRRLSQQADEERRRSSTLAAGLAVSRAGTQCAGAALEASGGCGGGVASEAALEAAMEAAALEAPASLVIADQLAL